jgi:hypothetical protein
MVLDGGIWAEAVSARGVFAKGYGDAFVGLSACEIEA